MLGDLTLPMTMSGTNVALPGIGTDLDATGASLQWVLTGYFLASAAFMLVAGSLGDMFGRRKIFALGAAIWTAGVVGSAAAPNILLLDVARTVTGIGSAGVLVCGAAILSSTFEGATRTRVFAAMGTTAGVGLAIGPSMSGLMIDELGWRMSFGVFAAVGLVLLAGTFFMRESRADERPQLDKPGMVTFILGLALLLYGISQSQKVGWGSPQVLVPLLAGLALLALFIRIEGRSRRPVLDLSLMRNRRYMAWCLSALVMGLGSVPTTMFLPTFLQGVNQTSSSQAGLIMLMSTAPVLVLPPLSGWLVNRGVSPRHLIAVPLLLFAAGNAWLTTLHPGISPLGLLGPLVMIGAGSGLAVGLIDAQAMGLVPAAKAGMASGFLNTIRGGANSLLIALFGAVLGALILARIGDADLAGKVTAGNITGPDRAFLADQFTDSYRILLWGTAVICAIGAITVHLMLAPSRRPAVPTSEPSDPREAPAPKQPESTH